MDKKTILIIEDEQYHRQVLEKILVQNNFFAVSAPDGYEGLKKIFELKPDLIILDILLPGLSGFAVLEKLSCRRDEKIKGRYFVEFGRRLRREKRDGAWD